VNCYLAYRDPRSCGARMVKQGIHWRLLVLGPLGLLMSRCWMGFALTGCVNMLLIRFAGPYGLYAASSVNLALAVFGAEVIDLEQRLRGRVCVGLWMGRSAGDARLRLADRGHGLS